MKRFIDVYETMLGLRMPEAQALGVEDAFAPGSICDQAYARMRNAYIHVFEMVGGEDDGALDAMVESLEMIQKDLCRRMYELGCREGFYDSIEGTPRKKETMSS